MIIAADTAVVLEKKSSEALPALPNREHAEAAW